MRNVFRLKFNSGWGSDYLLLLKRDMFVRSWSCARQHRKVNIPCVANIWSFVIVFFQLKNIWRIINTIASICCTYLSLDIITSSKLTVCLMLCSRKLVLVLEQIMFADEYLCIFSYQKAEFISVFSWVLADHI